MSTWGLLNCSNMTDLSRSSAWTSALCGSETLKADPPPQRAGEDGGRHRWGSERGHGSEGCDLFQMTLNYPFIPLDFPPLPRLIKHLHHHHHHTHSNQVATIFTFFIKYLKVILLLPGNARLRNILLQKSPSASKLYLPNGCDRNVNVYPTLCDFQGKC